MRSRQAAHPPCCADGEKSLILQHSQQFRIPAGDPSHPDTTQAEWLGDHPRLMPHTGHRPGNRTAGSCSIPRKTSSDNSQSNPVRYRRRRSLCKIGLAHRLPGGIMGKIDRCCAGIVRQPRTTDRDRNARHPFPQLHRHPFDVRTYGLRDDDQRFERRRDDLHSVAGCQQRMIGDEDRLLGPGGDQDVSVPSPRKAAQILSSG